TLVIRSRQHRGSLHLELSQVVVVCSHRFLFRPGYCWRAVFHLQLYDEQAVQFRTFELDFYAGWECSCPRGHDPIAEILELSEITLSRRHRHRWLARRAHRLARDVRR